MHSQTRSSTRGVAAVALALTMVASAVPADAAAVTSLFAGTILSADAGNPFGLGVGDSYSGSVTYDDLLATAAGSVVLVPDDDPAFALFLRVGNATFTDADDLFYSDGGPLLTFADGQLTGIDFIVSPFDAGSFASLDLALGASGLFITDLDTGGVLLVGGPAAVVPLPTAVPLLLSGLAGLAVVGARRPRQP